ncbi:MAG: hypothetical protein HYV63_14875 [Candidatus Schekmanbacteria bacterium]|nr:hypothetical protein [Candidatus Schekmanbacteria bacterium]
MRDWRKRSPVAPTRLVGVSETDTQSGERRSNRAPAQDRRKAGPLPVAHPGWQRLDPDDAFAQLGFPRRARPLTQAMAIYRLVDPLRERAMANWLGQTAISDILGIDLTPLGKDPQILTERR